MKFLEFNKFNINFDHFITDCIIPYLCRLPVNLHNAISTADSASIAYFILYCKSISAIISDIFKPTYVGISR